MKTKIFFIFLLLIISTLVVFSNDGVTGHKLLGWTSDGKIIAIEVYEYIDLPRDETNVIIISLVDDKILETVLIYEYEPTQLEEKTSEYEVDRRRENVLRKYNIVKSNANMKTFPIKWNNDEYKYYLKTWDNVNGGTGVDGYSLDIEAKIRGYKNVSGVQGNIGAVEARVLGAYVHPTQPRMCILIEFKTREYPDDDSYMTVSYKFIGCHLTYGYDKK